MILSSQARMDGYRFAALGPNIITVTPPAISKLAPRAICHMQKTPLLRYTVFMKRALCDVNVEPYLNGREWRVIPTGPTTKLFLVSPGPRSSQQKDVVGHQYEGDLCLMRGSTETCSTFPGFQEFQEKYIADRGF